MRRFERFEPNFDVGSLVRKEPVLELRQIDDGPCRIRQKCICGRTRLVGTWTIRSQHHPMHVQADSAINPAKNTSRLHRSRYHPSERRCKGSKGGHPTLQVARVSYDLPLERPSGVERLLRTQGMVRLLDQILQDFLVFERVHWTPKALMPECHQLISFDQSLKRGLD